jgi:hypothetical protein
MTTRRWAANEAVRGGLLVLLGIIGALAIGELTFPLFRFTPPHQMVRLESLRLLDGTPVWEARTDRQHRECVEQHPERTRILFTGSSITFGAGISAAETFTTELEERLNAWRPSPGFCVLNFAQPAFAFEQKWAVARKEIARYRPALTFIEHWDAEWSHFVLIGGAAYSTQGLKLGVDGFPHVPGVPGWLNSLLFPHLRIYEYLALSMATETSDNTGVIERFMSETLARVPAEARALGTRPIFFVASGLDRPFRDPDAIARAWRDRIRALARAQDVPTYSLADELADEDYKKVRLDPCCHFNPRGHEALARVFERIVKQQLDGR